MELLRVQRAAAAVLVAVGVAAGGQPAHAETPPPSLVRTLLAASESPLAVSGDLTVRYSCDMTVGGSLSVSYTASGTAVGPYPGVFSESGTLTGVVETAEPASGIAKGVLTSWQADFTIDSTVGDVSGTKRLATSTGFTCFDGGFRGQPYDEEHVTAIGTVTYQAVIRTSDGVFRDSGTATSDIAGSTCTQEPGPPDYCADLAFEYLAEDFFASDGVVVVPPTDPDPDPDTETHGASTGGGRVLSATDPVHAASFGYTVRSVDGRLHGTCNVLDQRAGVHVKCRTVDSYVQVGNTATWTGTAEVDGVVERYRISVQDSGEPNGADRFTLVTDTYSTSGPVTDGNVQVHRTRSA